MFLCSSVLDVGSLRACIVYNVGIENFAIAVGYLNAGMSFAKHELWLVAAAWYLPFNLCVGERLSE